MSVKKQRNLSIPACRVGPCPTLSNDYLCGVTLHITPLLSSPSFLPFFLSSLLTVIPSHSHTVTLSHCPTVIQSHRHTVPPSYRPTVKPSHRKTGLFKTCVNDFAVRLFKRILVCSKEVRVAIEPECNPVHVLS